MGITISIAFFMGVLIIINLNDDENAKIKTELKIEEEIENEENKA